MTHRDHETDTTRQKNTYPRMLPQKSHGSRFTAAPSATTEEEGAIVPPFEERPTRRSYHHRMSAAAEGRELMVAKSRG